MDSTSAPSLRQELVSPNCKRERSPQPKKPRADEPVTSEQALTRRFHLQQISPKRIQEVKTP
jgi:hypothetical protein